MRERKFKLERKYSNCEIIKVMNTHSWEPHKEITEFVYLMCNRSTSFQNFLDLTQTSTSNVVNFLTQCVDPDFPELQPDRMLRSFYTGILDLRTEMFYPYDKTIPSHLVCVEHYDQSFPQHIIFKRNFAEVHTPYFDSILVYQRLGPHVRTFMYAFLGRLLHPLQELDNWQVIFFIKGVAQSGKSTIGNVAKWFYKPEDVAVLSSNIEAKFGHANAIAVNQSQPR